MENRIAKCSTEFEDKVEALIDRSTLYDVLEALSTVCHAKAEHLESSWQDAHSAEVWTRAARQIASLIQKSKAIRSI